MQCIRSDVFAQTSSKFVVYIVAFVSPATSGSDSTEELSQYSCYGPALRRLTVSLSRRVKRNELAKQRRVEVAHAWQEVCLAPDDMHAVSHL